jgi:hypothetical protein
MALSAVSFLFLLAYPITLALVVKINATHDRDTVTSIVFKSNDKKCRFLPQASVQAKIKQEYYWVSC